MINNLFDVILKVLPILALIFLGVFMRRGNFLVQGAVGGMKRIVTDIALPSLLYLAFYRIKPDIRLLVVIAVIFMVCVVMVFIGRLTAMVIGAGSPYFSLLFGGFETGMLGYAIFPSVFGVDNVQKLALVDLGQVLFVFFVLMTLVTKLRDGVQSPVDIVKSFISSPVIIAIFLGVITSLTDSILGFTDNGIFQSFLQLLSLLGNMTAPLICIVIGYELNINFNSVLMPLKTILIRTSILLCIAFLINHFLFIKLLGLDIMYRYALITMFILPPPFVIPLFMKNEDSADKQYVLNSLSIGTVVSLVVFIVIIGLYR